MNPLSYAVVADIYPAAQRGRANALLSTGNFLGIGLSCITILLIKNIGWRGSYVAQGLLGIFSGIIGLSLLTGGKRAKIARMLGL